MGVKQQHNNNIKSDLLKGTLSEEATQPFLFLPPFLMGSNSLRKELAPVGVNSYLFYRSKFFPLTLLHSGRPKLYIILAFLNEIGLNPTALRWPKLHKVLTLLSVKGFKSRLNFERASMFRKAKKKT